MTTIRVALAEDNVLLREGISRLVAANDDFELVGVASDLPGLLSVVAEHDPDVVITDIRMPPTGTSEGIQAAAWLRKHRPQVGVVVLSQYTAPGGRAGPGPVTAPYVALVVADRAGVPDPRRDGPGQEQRGHRRGADRHRARGGEAHQLHLRQAGTFR